MLSDLLMWNKIGRIVTLLSERLDISPERALDIFYTSKTNERLHDPSTLLYTFGDLYIVDDVIRGSPKGAERNPLNPFHRSVGTYDKKHTSAG